MRREVPLLLTLSFGLFIVLSNFIVWEPWKVAAESVNNWALIVIAFTYVLGVGNLLRLHGVKIARRTSGWGYSAVTISGLVAMIAFGMILWALPQVSGGTVLRFRALTSVDLERAVTVSSPAGSGDAFDVRTRAVIVKDLDGDGSVEAGDEIETHLDYTYAGDEARASALFPVTYDPAVLTPLGPGGEALPLVPSAPGPDTEGRTGTTGAVALPGGGLGWETGPLDASPYGMARAGTGQGSVFTWFYDSVYVPMQSTMFALLAFFISSAAFRAFRVRSTHAVLLGVTAIVVILGSVPLGEAVWGSFPRFVGWVMNDLQTAGKRAILIGAALGAIATGIKMIVGAEKSYLSAD